MIGDGATDLEVSDIVCISSVQKYQGNKKGILLFAMLNKILNYLFLLNESGELLNFMFHGFSCALVVSAYWTVTVTK